MIASRVLRISLNLLKLFIYLTLGQRRVNGAGSGMNVVDSALSRILS